MPTRRSSGLPALDQCTDSLFPGDNVVFRFDGISLYETVCTALLDSCRAAGTELHYFRFAGHAPLFSPDANLIVHNVDPSDGFERVITDIHAVIRETGTGATHVFDVLSDLSATFFSDRMIGNFFAVTCPFLARLDTIAYFGVERHVHSLHAIQPIRDTTQLFIDLYEFDGSVYASPLKLQYRNDDDLLRMHLLKDDEAYPVTDSTTLTRVLSARPWPGLSSASYRMIGIWDRTLLKAEQLASSPDLAVGHPDRKALFEQTLRLVTGARGAMFDVLSRCLTLEDVIRIWKRMIGTGMIGGKSSGMLAANAILRNADPAWEERLEPHDSFYIGSDVYYTYLVENDCWWFRQLQKHPKHYLDRNEEIRARMLEGTFPDYILQRFSDMLDYFGTSPIIVRSSSLLEDAFGNAFAGKYDSIFCANQETREQRLEAFLDAVRWIYAGTMSREALEYRRRRGILDRDEQMALLVQRVSGTQHGDRFFPDMAGVGFSFNPYAWTSEIDPEAGVLRLVFGLGTRAVDRNDDDYTRVIALNAPALKPTAGPEEEMRYSQRTIDLISLKENRLSSEEAEIVLREAVDLPRRYLSRTDRDGRGVVRFDRLLSETSFVNDMKTLLATIQQAYGSPVDVEFTVNLDPTGAYTLNVVQCRPLQVQSSGGEAAPLPDRDTLDILIRTGGGIVGHSRHVPVDRIVLVDPKCYGQLPEQKRYAVARALRHVTARTTPDERILLVGPGRWATSTPSLGVPVHVEDIAEVSMLMEIDIMHDGLVPDLSLGTHVFHEMVEMNMLYIAHSSRKPGNSFHWSAVSDLPEDVRSRERLQANLTPEVAACLRVYSCDPGRTPVWLYADARSQECLIYRTTPLPDRA